MVGLPERALRYARAIARSRLVGSSGEKAVREEIARLLEQFGYRLERQRFRCLAPLGAVTSGQLLVGSLMVISARGLRGIAKPHCQSC